MSEEKKIENNEDATVEIIGVNFREAGKIYYFAPKRFSLSVGEKVIVETSKGTEIGTVKIANKFIPQKELTSPLKAIARAATKEDLEHHRRNKDAEIDAAIICKRKIAQHKLQMSLVAAEYTFDNSKLTFYFTADGRIDFRDLVKDLASTFRTRIELRQIGIRDEAKFMGGLGICGRPFCCSSFLPDFVQVSIKMAKEQNLSLNSAKISGACGRLMCCLRYEYDTYLQEAKLTPAVDSTVKTEDGTGTVVEANPLKGTVKVSINDNVKVYKRENVKVISSPKGKKSQSVDKNEADESSESK